MCCNRFLSTRQLPFYVALSLLMIGTILFYLYPVRHLWQLYTLYVIPIIVIMLIIFIGVLIVFLQTSCLDPGVIPRQVEDPPPVDPLHVSSHEDIKVKQISYRMKWCETCRFYRPPRCSHCSVCNNCVYEFDHHCPWVDNCVARRNYKYFVIFLMLLSLYLIIGCLVCVITVVLYRHTLILVIIELLLIFLTFIILLLVVPLLGFHCGLIYSGRNTHEHMSSRFRNITNPFDRGCFNNFLTVLCGPMQPAFITYNVHNNNNNNNNNNITNNNTARIIFSDREATSLYDRSSLVTQQPGTPIRDNSSIGPLPTPKLKTERLIIRESEFA